MHAESYLGVHVSVQIDTRMAANEVEKSQTLQPILQCLQALFFTVEIRKLTMPTPPPPPPFFKLCIQYKTWWWWLVGGAPENFCRGLQESLESPLYSSTIWVKNVKQPISWDCCDNPVYGSQKDKDPWRIGDAVKGLITCARRTGVHNLTWDWGTIALHKAAQGSEMWDLSDLYV